MSITPGPWKLETAPEGANGGWSISVEKAKDEALKEYRYIILAQRGPIEGEEFACNACAIAEVPDMLEIIPELAAYVTNELIRLKDLGADFEKEREAARATLGKVNALLRRINGEEEQK